MLNYVWLAILMLGIGAALTTDIINTSTDKFRGGQAFPAEVVTDSRFVPGLDTTYEVKLKVNGRQYSEFYNETSGDFVLSGKLTVKNNNNTLIVNTAGTTPKLWKEIAATSGDKEDLIGKLNINNVSGETSISGNVVLEEASFTKLREITGSALDYAGRAVEIALGLIGIMAMWLGIMKIADEAGLIKKLANLLKPITKRIFPEVPSDHPAMGSMIMNISANMLGLSNAATPFGLKAMEELNKLNTNPGTATNAMVTFLAVNTAGMTLIPASAIAIRAASGSSDPAIIIGTSLFGSTCATIAGLTAAKFLGGFRAEKGSFSKWIYDHVRFIAVMVVVLGAFIALAATGVFAKISFNTNIIKSVIQVFSTMAIPALIVIFVGYGAVKKVKVYEMFVEGAKEGFNVAIRIIPYLVAMLVAIGVFRAGGAMDWLIYILTPITSLIGMPAEALPMALMRPLSGSGSLGIMTETISIYGPDSFIGILVSTFFGSSETTFYVLAVYFGSVNIKNTRHALASGLIADVAGALGALFIVKLLFGGM